jgi:hypothetical protein
MRLTGNQSLLNHITYRTKGSQLDSLKSLFSGATGGKQIGKDWNLEERKQMMREHQTNHKLKQQQQLQINI